MKRCLFVLLLLFFISCKGTKQIQTPSYIAFSLANNSELLVSATNPLACPTFITLQGFKEDSIINFKPFESKTILRLKDSLRDTISVLKEYDPKMKYGSYPFTKYDTSYNYALPFKKGKRYRIMQGHFGNFSHNSNFSKYAIDIRMNEGQPVCAMRDGIVIKVKKNSKEGGNDMRFYDKANYILIYHKDGTFSQYVHLKYNGAVVRENDSVKKGQVIGYSGNTGYSTAPHLHFGVFKPTISGFVSLPYTLDSIPSKNYKKGKYALNN